jgi:hypothetical protein
MVSDRFVENSASHGAKGTGAQALRSEATWRQFASGKPQYFNAVFTT